MLKRKKMARVAAWTAVCLLAQSQTMPAYGAGISESIGKTAGTSRMKNTTVSAGAGTSRLQNTALLTGGRSGEAPTGVGLEDLEINPEDGDSASVPVEMKGTVTASLISVSLPADGFEFSVDPEVPFDLSAPAAQILSPDVKIENHSVVPVKLEIARVDDIGDDDVKFSEKFSDAREQTFQLVDTIAGANAPGTAILVLGMENRQYQTSREFEHYAICPGKTGIYVAEIEAGGQTTLKLYGKVSADFYGSYEFTVRPTLKISAVQANEPADSYRE